MTPARGHHPWSFGPGSRSTTETSWPRRASATAVNRPVGPAPMMATRMVIPRASCLLYLFAGGPRAARDTCGQVTRATHAPVGLTPRLVLAVDPASHT